MCETLVSFRGLAIWLGAVWHLAVYSLSVLEDQRAIATLDSSCHINPVEWMRLVADVVPLSRFEVLHYVL